MKLTPPPPMPKKPEQVTVDEEFRDYMQTEEDAREEKKMRRAEIQDEADDMKMDDEFKIDEDVPEPPSHDDDEDEL